MANSKQNNQRIEPNFALTALPDEAEYFWEQFQPVVVQNKLNTTDQRCIATLFGQSHFLSQYVVRHGEMVKKITRSPHLNKKKCVKDFCVEIARELDDSSVLDPAIILRRYKYRELCRITIKDLCGCPQEDVLYELSALADTILQAAHQICYNHLLNKFGAPLLHHNSPAQHHIAAMGKLGGYELNYSSDVDLLAMMDDDRGSSTNQIAVSEFFSRLLQEFTTLLEYRSEHGFLYRVDWDLRPEGRAGPLINTLQGMEEYYENFGMDWERQALLKFRPLLGNSEVAEQFLSRLEPFIFRKHLDFKGMGHLVEIRDKLYQQWSAQNTADFHVKLDTGGIREIEFFVQIFQQIYGGHNPKLRHRATLDALSALAAESLIPKHEAELLRIAYLFLRKLEHRLQMIDEEQTHLFPNDPPQQIACARRMGYRESAAQEARYNFLQDLRSHRTLVHRLFEELFLEIMPAARPPLTTYLRPTAPHGRRYRDELRKKLEQLDNHEQILDALRIFKRDHVQEIQVMERNKKWQRRSILYELSQLAEAVCAEAIAIATTQLRKRFGDPLYGDPRAPKGHAFLSVIAMGKLGGAEINYASDLDLIFIFSEEGQTSGSKQIYNSEYFARLAQKFIGLMTVPTAAGYLYKIDTELRPSGNFGTLVTSLKNFIEYQKKVSQIWERQALLRARPIAGSVHLCRIIKSHIEALLNQVTMDPPNRQEMHRLRMRVETELARESPRNFDYKRGMGGLMDIEFILQYYQLSHPFIHALKTPNTFEGLHGLNEAHLMSSAHAGLILIEAYEFMRTLESKLQLLGCSESRLEPSNASLITVAAELGFSSVDGLVQYYREYSREVRKIYAEVFLSHARRDH